MSLPYRVSITQLDSKCWILFIPKWNGVSPISVSASYRASAAPLRAGVSAPIGMVRLRRSPKIRLRIYIDDGTYSRKVDGLSRSNTLEV